MMVRELLQGRRKRLLGAVVVCVVLIAGLIVLLRMGSTVEAAILTALLT